MKVISKASITGPKINPMNPNKLSPPKTPISTKTGCTFACIPINLGLSKLSILLMTINP